jgi:hypothetical protein
MYGATRRVAGDRSLNYSVLRSDLDSGLRRGPEGSTLRAAIEAVPTVQIVVLNGHQITLLSDSLAIRDTIGLPALRPAGFLSDQISRYNRYRRIRAEQIARGIGVAGDEELIDIRETETPSIFRTVALVRGETSVDTVILGNRVVTSSMRVASPFDEHRAISITSREAPSNTALVSGSGISFFTGKGTTPGSFGCPFTTRKDSISIQCRAPGGPRREILIKTDQSGAPATLTVFSNDVIRYDGVMVKANQPREVKPGGLLLLPPSQVVVPGTHRKPGPQSAAFERTGAGTFGGIQWVNGRMLWRSSPGWNAPFLQQLASGSGFASKSDLMNDRVIPLSLDERFTKATQSGLERFVRARQDRSRINYATVVIADARTGEILSVAELGHPSPGQGSRALAATNFGSAVKPILATAILSRLPELASLRIYDPGGTVTELWGQPIDSLSTNCGTGWIDLRRFLACSSNLYAASLTSAALQGAEADSVRWVPGYGGVFEIQGRSIKGRRPSLGLDPSGRVLPDSLLASALSFGLDSLFGISTSIELADTQEHGQDSSVWEGLHYLNGAPISSPRGLWAEASRVGLSRRGEVATLRQVAAMAIGAGENRISPLMMVQSFARVVTDKKLTLRFAPLDDFPAMAASLGLRSRPWYKQILGGLEDVTRPGGTAEHLSNPLIGSSAPRIRFFAKTGTLNARPVTLYRTSVDTVIENRHITVKRSRNPITIPGVAVKTLSFAVGESASEEISPLKCGIVGSIYFKLRLKKGELVPELAQNLASEALWPVIRENWQRLRLCPTREVKR